MKNIESIIITWEDVVPPIIPNTTMRKRLRDGVPQNYTITPIEGYVLHIKGKDSPIEDPETHEDIGLMLGYSLDSCTCAITYDFTPTEVLDENGNRFVAYGTKEEYFTIPKID